VAEQKSVIFGKNWLKNNNRMPDCKPLVNWNRVLFLFLFLILCIIVLGNIAQYRFQDQPDALRRALYNY